MSPGWMPELPDFFWTSAPLICPDIKSHRSVFSPTLTATEQAKNTTPAFYLAANVTPGAQFIEALLSFVL